MIGLLLLLFLAAPVVDLYLLYRIGGVWGFWPTAALVLGTAVLGFSAARAQGSRMLAGLRGQLAAGRAPGRDALNGLAVLAGSVLLVTPGPLGDALGLALLLPPTRWLLMAAGRRSLERAVATGAMRVSVLRWQPPPGPGSGPEEGSALPGLDPSKEIRVGPPE